MSSTQAALAFAFSALGAGFLACSGEFQYAECPAGTEQNGGGDVSEACKSLGGSGGSGGATGTGGAGLSGAGGVGGVSGSGNTGQGGGGASGAAGAGGSGGAGGGVVPGPAGTLDASFGKGGKADFGALTIKQLDAFGFQSTGKIVAAGLGLFSDGSSKSLVMRFDDAGTLDAGFGQGSGYGVDSINTKPWYRLAVLEDDRIVGAPFQGISPDPARIVRLQAEGVVDPSFTPVTADLYSLLVDLAPSGGAGYYYTYKATSSNTLTVVKYSGANGEVKEYSMAPKVDNKTITSGVADTVVLDFQKRLNLAYSRSVPGKDGIPAPHFYGLARVSSEGEDDVAFSWNGGHDFGLGDTSWLALDKLGRLLATGRLGTSAVLSRSFTTGEVDATFGNAGTTPLVPSTRWRCAVADEGERAVVVGTYVGGDSQAIRLGRYGQNGFPDVTYGIEGSGFATLAQGAEVSVSMCKLDKQGRLLIAGAVRASAGAPLAPFLARVWN